MQINLKKLYPYLLIACIGFAAYAQILRFEFVHLDEDELIIGNQNFISNLGNIFEAFKHDVNYPSGFSAYYRPLLTLTFMADAFVGGLDPFFYHFTNIIIHLIASLLAYVLIEKLSHRKVTAIFFALILSVHPVLNQAVAWIPGRNDSLLAVFIFVAFMSFLDLITKEKKSALLVHAVFFTLAMFTKETAIALPIICLAYYYTVSPKKLSHYYKYSLAGVWIGVFGGWFILRNAVLKTQDLGILNVIQLVVSHLWAVLIYASKIVLPINLSILPTIVDSSVSYGLFFLLTILILVIISRKFSRLALFGLIWFLIFLVPSLISYDYESRIVFFEHRLYVPILGFLILLSEINWRKIFSVSEKLALPFMVGIIGALFVITTIHLRDFKNRLSFWQSAINGSPHLARAHNGFGTALLIQGDFDLAEKEYLIALGLNPDEQKIHNNLGILYINKKMLDKAEDEFKKEIEINPRYEVGYYNLAKLYARKGRFGEAEKYWLKSLALKPDYIQVHQDLAVYYFQSKNYEKSLYHINEIIRYNAPLYPELAKVKVLLESQGE